MSTIVDGGKAFPSPSGMVQNPNQHFPQYHTGNDGMSLRDWFAGQALAGIGMWAPGQDPHDAGARAKWAYAQADAMLAAREAAE